MVESTHSPEICIWGTDELAKWTCPLVWVCRWHRGTFEYVCAWNGDSFRTYPSHRRPWTPASPQRSGKRTVVGTLVETQSHSSFRFCQNQMRMCAVHLILPPLKLLTLLKVFKGTTFSPRMLVIFTISKFWVMFRVWLIFMVWLCAKPTVLGDKHCGSSPSWLKPSDSY